MSNIPVNCRMARGRAYWAAIIAIAIAETLYISGILDAPIAQAADPVDAIKARIEEYRNVWDTHDENAVAAFYTEDAAFVIGNLPAVSGRQIVAAWWGKYFERQEPERQIAIEINSIRPITADSAIANITTTTGGQDANGGELLSRRARGTWLMRHQDGGWFIAALYAMPPADADVILNTSMDAAKALTPRIRAFVEDYENTFNRHDPAALGALYTDDAEIIVRNGPLIHGRQAIDEWWRTYFSEPRPYRAIFIVNQVRMITPDVALLDVTGTGVPNESGDEVTPVRHAHVGWIVVHQANGWRVSALRVLPSEDDRIIRASDRQAN